MAIRLRNAAVTSAAPRHLAYLPATGPHPLQIEFALARVVNPADAPRPGCRLRAWLRRVKRRRPDLPAGLVGALPGIGFGEELCRHFHSNGWQAA